jgi:uncharacterized protein YjbI with pentapeptide repeats
MLEVNEKKLRKELAEAWNRLERPGRTSWLELEPVARILHWLGDPRAATYFRQAAEDRTVRADEAGWYLAIGNYYRLAGDPEKAGEWLRRAYEAFREEPSDYSVPYVDCAYLLGEYEEAVALGERWNYEHLPAVVLSRARLEGDASLARNLVGDLADHIRRHLTSLKEKGYVLHSWDRYELAMQAMEDLGGTVKEDEPPRKAPVRRRLMKGQVQEILEESDEDQDLTAVDRSGMDFAGEDFTNALLVDSDLRDANFSNAVFIETNMQGADLSGAILEGALLQQAILSGVNLKGVRLNLVENKNLTYADLSRTDLRDFDLSGMDLRMADLSDANLQGADLSGADLRHADLTDANLTGANLQGANLEGTDLDNAITNET